MSEDPKAAARRSFLKDVASEVGDHAAKALEKRLAAFQVPKRQQSPEDLSGSQPQRYYQYDGAPRPFFRPPGAIPESEFLELCSRCNICVEVCPEECISPARLDGEAMPGTPVMDPNHRACTLCGECMDRCPTGALLPVPAEFVRVGEASVTEQSCLAHGGESCDACAHACPTSISAIAMVSREGVAVSVPQVSHESCTGCGLCVPACPTEFPSINVRIRMLEESDLEKDFNDWT